MKTLYTNLHMGDTTNLFNIDDADGQITWGGTYLKSLNLRPQLVQTTAKASGTPTQVTRGLNVGYSLPVWNSSDEELYFRMRMPARWDGTTDPQLGLCVTLMNGVGEDVGDKFKLQLEWQTTAAGAVLGCTVCYLLCLLYLQRR
jgi:hypothetical protein